MLQRIPRLRSRIIVATLVALSIIYLYFFTEFNYNSEFSFQKGPETITPKPKIAQPKTKKSEEFWTKIFKILEDNEVKVGDLGNAIRYINKENHIEGFSKEALLSKADISDEVFNELKQKHEATLKQLPKSISEHTYNKDTKGVVLVGGGKYSWLAYLSIVALRDTGSNLPVEVLLPSYIDYQKELEFCTKILPELSAACIVLPDMLGTNVMLKWKPKIKSYQFKSLALMTSSFQHILLLDSDNIVVTNPDSIFESDLYKENGMITWPDYWMRTISPKYYDIAGLKVNEKKRVRYNRFPLQQTKSDGSHIEDKEIPFHDLQGAIPDLSTESGQLVINKGTHGQTLLLSLYYNVYGPNLFYKLFSLGEQGEGDKDTFVAAAEVTKQTYYQLKSFIKPLGYFDSDGNFQGVAMGQKDPLADYKTFKERVVDIYNGIKGQIPSFDDQIVTLKKVEKDYFDGHSDFPPLFAIHCNYPKLDPLQLKTTDNIFDKENNRMKYRMYNNFKVPKSVIVNGERKIVQADFELIQWTNIHSALCDKKLSFTHFSSANKEELCEFLRKQLSWLSESV